MRFVVHEPGRLGPQLAVWAAVVVAAVTAAVTIRVGTFVPAITDASGYISAGELWRRGELVRADAVSLWAGWADGGAVTSPLAYRPGPLAGTQVPTYPPGLPILIGGATAVGGELAGYVVAPVMAGAMVLCAFGFARRVAGDMAGLLAAGLAAVDPVILLHVVHPMSDVPAAACWLLAWWFALRATGSASITAGLLAGLGVLIRPNLAPLAVVLALVVLVRPRELPHDAGGAVTGRSWRRWRWREVCAFGAAAATGPVILAWSQAVLYGNPLQSGYGRWQQWFALGHISTNLEMYPRLLVETHSWLLVAGLAVVAAAGLTRALTADARRVVLSGAALAAVNVLIYLPYTPYDHWAFLRFLLPALVILLVCLASVVAIATRLAWRRVGVLAVFVPCLLLVVPARERPFTSYALDDWRAQTRIRLMGKYLAEALPADAVLLSFAHSGALAHYTGRAIVRVDLLPPADLDAIVDDLARHGYRPMFVLDSDIEVPRFRERFPASRFAALDWAPRAVATSIASIVWWDTADLARHRRGERWPTDVLR